MLRIDIFLSFFLFRMDFFYLVFQTKGTQERQHIFLYTKTYKNRTGSKYFYGRARRATGQESEPPTSGRQTTFGYHQPTSPTETPITPGAGGRALLHTKRRRRNDGHGTSGGPLERPGTEVEVGGTRTGCLPWRR